MVARSDSRGFGFGPEQLQQSWPATVDILAHRFASFGAHLLELAMLQVHTCGICAVGDEPDLDLGADRRVGLPVAVDVPGHHKTLGWLPYDDPADIRLRSVFCQFIPTAAEARFHDGRLHWLVSDAVVARPPPAEAGRESIECAGLGCVDANSLAHRRDLDRHRHLPLLS